MDTQLETLLKALATAPGATIFERMNFLCKAQVIFSGDRRFRQDLMKIAHEMDVALSNRAGAVQIAVDDITASNLSRRLKACRLDISPQSVRNQPTYWNEAHVETQEREYRHAQDMRRGLGRRMRRG